MTVHKVARIDVRMAGYDEGRVTLACEHHNLLVTEGSELVESWVEVLAVGDSLSVTLTTDHQTVMRLAGRGEGSLGVVG